MPTKFVRFPVLQQRGIVKSWPMLKRRIERDGFPRGRMIGPNSRAWTEDEIEDWIASRPVAGPEPRGIAKRRRGQPSKTDGTEPTTAERAP
jgi:predicted DNA-binding transcriptional regulator AlpA